MGTLFNSLIAIVVLVAFAYKAFRWIQQGEIRFDSRRYGLDPSPIFKREGFRYWAILIAYLLLGLLLAFIIWSGVIWEKSRWPNIHFHFGAVFRCAADEVRLPIASGSSSLTLEL